MKSYRCDDWSRLAGADVEIRVRGNVVRSGVVDVVMPDATILWLAADYNGNRPLRISRRIRSLGLPRRSTFSTHPLFNFQIPGRY